MFKAILAEQIDLIYSNLNTVKIIDYLSQSEIEKKKLLQLIIGSGNGFHDIIKQKDSLEFIESIEEHSIYNSEEFTALIIFVSTMDVVKTDEEQLSLLNKFLVFHKILFKTGNLVKKLSSADTDKLKEAKTSLSTQSAVYEDYTKTDQLLANAGYTPFDGGAKNENQEAGVGEEIGLAEFLKSLNS